MKLLGVGSVYFSFLFFCKGNLFFSLFLFWFLSSWVCSYHENRIMNPAFNRTFIFTDSYTFCFKTNKSFLRCLFLQCADHIDGLIFFPADFSFSPSFYSSLLPQPVCPGKKCKIKKEKTEQFCFVCNFYA